jgi:hypothetical protein
VNLENPSVQTDSAGPVLLHGFAVSGPASLTGPLVRVGPLRKISFLVGRNNHGKSTILRATQLFTQGPANDSKYVEAYLDTNRGRRLGAPSFASREVLLRLTQQTWPEGLRYRGTWDDVIERAAAINNLLVDGDQLLLWQPLQTRSGIRLDPKAVDLNAWGRLLGRQISQDEIVQSLQQAGPASQNPWGPVRAHIPAFREIRPADDSNDKIGPDRGVGIINELQRWQNPDKATKDHQLDESRFRRLIDLLRDVLDDPTAELHVPHNLRTIQVKDSPSSTISRH